MKSKALITFLICCSTQVLWSSPILDSLFNAAKILESEKEYEQGAQVFKEALTYAEQEGNLLTQAHIHSHLNGIFFKLSRYNEGIRESEYSLELFKEMKMWNEAAGNYYNLGLNYKKIGSIDMAMKNFLSSLKIAEKLGDKE